MLIIEKLLIKYKEMLIAECPECKKEGNIVIDCKNNCQQKLLKASKYIEAGIPTKYFNLDLNTFLNVPSQSILSSKIRKNIFDSMNDYIKNLEYNFNKGKGILLKGSFGTGKSTISMHIAKVACDAGKRVIVREFSDMVNISKTGMDTVTENEINIMNEFINTDLYCIENLEYAYSKKFSDYVPLFLDSILTASIKYSIPIIITTNFSDDQLSKEFNEHIYSLFHELDDYNVPGVDIRKELHERRKGK